MTGFSGIGNQIVFNVSSTGPQGANGLPYSGILNLTASQAVTATQSGLIFNNSGAGAEVDLSLPTSPSPIYPLTFSLFVAEAQIFSFIAPTGVTISNGADSSSAGGSLYSSTVGNFVTVALVTPTQWIVTNITGVWSLA